MLRPVLADEPLVGTNLTRRVRITLVAIAVALLLSNVSAYLIGQAFAEHANERTDQRIAALEADLAERRAARDRMDAQLRRDACTLADELAGLVPDSQRLRDFRARYGCTGTPTATRSPSPPAPSPGGRTDGTAGTRGTTGHPAPAPRPGPTRTTPAPSPTGTTRPPTDGGLLCLPLVGCIL